MAYIDIENLQAVLLDDEALRARHLRRKHCGTLNITSGRLVACDPMVQPEREPFVRSVAARGAFAVEVLHDRGTHALAVLWLRERSDLVGQSLQWELALLDGQSAAELGDDHFYGYPVDAGLGCFMDAEAAAAIAQREARQTTEDPGCSNDDDDVLAVELGEGDSVDHFPLGAGTLHNVVVVRSGWGDGVYPSFWALDTAGEPVALVTDFMTICGGDARDEEDKRDDAYRASLSPEKLAALEALGRAAAQGDVAAIGSLLGAGLVHANEIVPSAGETALWCAVRMNRTEALRTLLGTAPCPPLPQQLHYGNGTVNSYLSYARRLKKPRDPALIALLEAAEARVPGTGAPDAAAAPAARTGFWKRLLS